MEKLLACQNSLQGFFTYFDHNLGSILTAKICTSAIIGNLSLAGAKYLNRAENRDSFAPLLHCRS
jgi:hypothetical protein